jgi:hypothetical protein
MKKFLVFIFLFSILFVFSCRDDDSNGVTDPDENYPDPTDFPTTNGTIISDEVWADTLSLGYVTISEGAAVTILPGTVIQGGEIVVKGKLDVLGEAETPIYFVSDICTRIHFDNDFTESRIEYSWFQGGMMIDSYVIRCSGERPALIYNSVFRISYPLSEKIIICDGSANPTIFNNEFLHVGSSFKEGCAIECRDYSYPDISDNKFSQFEFAVYSDHQSYPYLIRNEMTQNIYGVYCAGDASLFYENTIKKNEYGVFINDSTNLGEEGNSFVGYNSIYNNTEYNLVINVSETVKAENNYWGTRYEDIIQDYIYDGRDDPALGIVDYNPYFEYE